ncbi:proline-rich receptor-like protein kinase PERK1 isoform X2 [Catharus ustulatus]|uniref:proline-rich receptor-like protein kinase PERK1 isoform X2 n=1 Tax=Catharus ustulatus TaxID=91951 RepID=UPI00140C69E4|nr:proline-rich receptor-like protein kinase PERK1 isoform X2 [Catharus ustulatus]
MYKPSSHDNSPPTGKAQYTEDKKSLEAAKHLNQMLSNLERRRVMNQKSVQRVVVPGISNGSLASQPGSATQEALGKSDTHAENPPSTPGVFCPQDVRRSCMIGTVVTVFTVPLSMVLCYVGFRWWKESKHRPAAAPAPRPRRRDSPSPPRSPRPVRFDSSQTWPQQQQSTRKAEHQASVPPPRPPSPAVMRKPPEIPPPPPLPSQPPWSS